MENKWLACAKRIQAIAQAGITYSVNDYDLERYQELREISATLIADLSHEKIEVVLDLFKQEVGYQTPKVDVRGVVFKEGKILMIQEKADNCWSLPGGWADVGYSPAEVAVKEVGEESGLKVAAKRLLGILDKKFHDHPPDIYHVYKIFIECEEVGGALMKGMETLDVGYFAIDNLPELSRDRITEQQIQKLFGYYKGLTKEPFFD